MTNEIHQFYLDWQNEIGLLGTAIVDEIVGNGLPFILSEQKDNEQIVYNYHKVKVTWIELTELGKSLVHSENSTFKKRYVESNKAIGAQTGGMNLEFKENNQISDRFIVIHGISVF